MALAALLLDLDGTLVDSNPAHALAWARATADIGHPVPEERTARAIGMGGDLLVPELLGETLGAERGEALGEAEGRYFREHAGREALRLFPGARRLVRAARDAGLRVALVTSSDEQNLDALFASVGTDLRPGLDLVTTASDVDASKPEPDVVAEAARRLGLPPAACALVGDTAYDGHAATRAGAAFIGVRTGVWTADELREAGARGVYADARALAENLAEALERAAPGPHALTEEAARHLMEAALAQAERGLEEGGVPIGAAIGRADGTVLARGHNRARASGNRLRHAETEALAALFEAGDDEPGLVLATTLEPCAMCLGAATEAGLHAVLYALDAPPNGARGLLSPPAERPVPLVARAGGRAASRALLARWAEAHPEDAFVRGLLAATDGG